MDEEYGVPMGAKDRETFQYILGTYGGPAFVRRQRAMEDSWDRLLVEVGAKRRDLLQLVALRLGQLFHLADDVARLRTWTSSGDVERLVILHGELQPVLRVPLKRSDADAAIQAAFRTLVAAMHRFNERWKQTLNVVDLGLVNQLRDGYNRYYLLEKECALGSSVAARRGFVTMAPATHADLLEHFPLLPIPTLK